VISIVVCTRDRAARLSRTLASYEALTTAEPWELIVVINGSVDATAEVVERFRSTSALPIRVLQQARAGVCAARNRGWREAGGEVVAFVDDDCYPASDFLAQLRTCFDEGRLGFAGGPMLLYDSTDLSWTSIQTSTTRIDLEPPYVFKAGLIHGGNMAFRRDVLEAIDGFDECLGAGTSTRSGGDLDAVSRASAAGFRGAYDPRPVVAHHHGRKTAAEGSAVMRGYDLGRGAFYVKCLLDPVRRRLYAWQILRRAAAHLIRRRFATFRYEIEGARLYLRCVRCRPPSSAAPD